MSDNTFHITPSDELAMEAAVEVSSFDPETWVAIRGQEMDSQDVLYTVSACPNQEDQSGYNWTYVRAGEWMEQYEDY